MRYQDFVRGAAGVLATTLLCSGAAFAQARVSPQVMTDAAPLPAYDRSSVGAVVMTDDPVLAQEQMMQQAQARSGVDTRTMGAGPARVLRDLRAKRQLQEQLKALDAAEQNRVTPK